ncbi:MAG: hypothetical protein WBP08_01495 [Saprospiraceae bacterium]|jgi:Zn-finger domain-containing protein
MAVFAISNPKRSTIVNFPIEKISESIENIGIINKKYKLSNSTPAFHQYTFDVSEFISLGAFVDVNLNQVSDEKTEITIEVRRKIGTFDQSHEVSLANTHIENMFGLIAKITTNDISNLVQENLEKKTQSKWYNGAFGLILCAILLWPLAIYGVLKSNLSKPIKYVTWAIIIFWIIYIFLPKGS